MKHVTPADLPDHMSAEARQQHADRVNALLKSEVSQ